jgi:hypothetical protein
MTGRSFVAAPVLLVALLPGLARAEVDPTFLAQHKVLLARQDLQFTFTTPPPPPRPSTSARWLLDLLEALQPILEPLFWTILAAVVAFIAYFILRELVLVRFDFRPRRKDSASPTLQDIRPPPERARLLLSEVDRLAAEGRYADAARRLLHRSIQDIEERRPGGLSRALTSREIASKALPEPARSSFVTIARIVERGFFGHSPVGADDFAACRDAYARFALPEAGS